MERARLPQQPKPQLAPIGSFAREVQLTKVVIGHKSKVLDSANIRRRNHENYTPADYIFNELKGDLVSKRLDLKNFQRVPHPIIGEEGVKQLKENIKQLEEVFATYSALAFDNFSPETKKELKTALDGVEQAEGIHLKLGNGWEATLPATLKPLFSAPKEELLGRLNDQQKDLLAYALDIANLPHEETGKRAPTAEDIQGLHDTWDWERKQPIREMHQRLRRRIQEIEQEKSQPITGEERNPVNLPDVVDPQEKEEVQTRLQKWQEIQEQERKDPIPTPEDKGIDLDRLEAVREKLKELQDQEWHPTPTEEEVRHLTSLPNAADPLDREEIRANLTAWKKQETTASTTEIRHIINLPDVEDPQKQEDIQTRFAAWKEQTQRHKKPDDEEGMT